MGLAQEERIALRRVGLPALLLLGLAILFFPAAFFGRGAFFHYDTWLQNFTFRAWWFGQLKAGHFATWCPGMFAGYPLFAETQTGPLYPPTFLLFMLLPPTLAFSWSVVLHFALAGFGTILLLRRLGVSLAAATFAGVSYAFSGFLVTHVVHFNLLVGAAWLPFAVWLALGAWNGERRALLGLAAVFACLLLGAHPYATLMTFVLLVLLLPFAARGRPGGLVRGALILAGAAALAALIAGVQILPARELIARTERGAAVAWSFLTFGSYPPWELSALANPELFGTPVNGSFFAGVDWSLFAETCAYVGLLAIAFVPAAFLLRRDATTLAFATGAGVSLLLMLGRYTPLYRAVAWIPLLQSTRLPARFALLFTLCLIVLAALGLEALWKEREPRRRLRACVIGAALVGALVAWAWIAGGGTRDPGPEISGAGRLWPEKLDLIRETARSSANRMLVMTALALASLALLASGRRLRGLTAWLPALVAFLDLHSFGASFNPVIPPDAILAPPPVVRALPAVHPRPRIFRQGVDELWERSPGMPRTDLVTPAWRGNESSYVTGAWALPPNSQLLYKVDSGEGFTSLIPSQWLEWMGIAGQPGATPRPDLNEGQADLLAIDGVLSTGAGIAGDGWRAEPLPGDLWLSYNLDPLPRARLAHSWRTLPREKLLASIRDESRNPRAEVLLETAPPGLAESATGGATDEPLRATENAPGDWSIHVPAASGGLVVLAEAYDPGWRASGPAGEDLEIVRADGLFVGFAAPPAGGEVRVRHSPASVRRGVLLSLLGLAALAAFTRWPRGAMAHSLPGSSGASAGPIARAVVIAAPLLVIAASGALDVGGARAARSEHSLRTAALRSWTEEAHAAYRAGALGPAAELLQRAASLFPEDAQVQYRLGLVEKARGRSAAARTALERALSLDPNLTAARSALTELSEGKANTDDP
jgi:hypothetical protein